MLKAIGVALTVASMLALAAIALGYTSVGYGADMPMQGPERFSPADRINWEQIVIERNGVRIGGMTGVRLVSLADTNSMDPTLDAEATAIEIVPASAEDLHVGDIISYQSGSDVIIHRIVETGSDANGWYAVAKGDNNAVPDPAKVRFEQVKGVVVGIVY